MKRSVVITGATGLLGTYLAAELVGTADVLLVVASDTDRPQIGRVRRRLETLLGATGRATDVLDKVLEVPWDGVRAALRGSPAQVWHVGAALSPRPDDMPTSFDADVNATMELLQATSPAERFFLVSTVGITGPGGAKRREWVPEAPWWRVESVNPYIVSKLLSEHMVDNWRTVTGTPITVIRPGSLLGPARGPLVLRSRAGYFALLDMVARATRQGSTLGLDVDPRCRPAIVHIDDLAGACGRLSELAAAGGPLDPYYHVTGGQQVPNSEQVAAINRAAGTRAIAVCELSTSLDGSFAQVNADNIAFMNSGFVYGYERLERVLPSGRIPTVTAGSFEKFARDMLAPATVGGAGTGGAATNGAGTGGAATNGVGTGWPGRVAR
jgi:nucleoside-diphosphate-sugar epimerase